MKILLAAVNTKYIHFNPALRLLKAYLGETPEDTEVRIREYTINHYAEDVLAGIYEETPDVIMFSCYIWNWNFIRGLFPDLKKVLPDAQLWLGGPEVSFDPERILEDHPEVKGILLGEGEATFRELVLEHYVLHRKDLTRIPGLCVRTDRILRTGDRPLLSMDEIPFFYNEEVLRELEHKILYYESSRGCPFRCSYCLSSVSRKVRLRSLEKVYPELQFFLDHRVKQVKFVDRTFNADRDHTMGILTYLAEHDNQVTNFHFEVAGDLITEEELALMSRMRPGLIQLEIGVQTTHPETIRAIHRTMDLERLRQVVKRIYEMGTVHIHLDLIAGLPFEGPQRFRKSFDDVYQMHPAQLQLGFLKVLKGSSMYTDADKYHILYRTDPPYEVLSTEWMSYKEILKLKRLEEMVEVYYNSRQFTKTLEVLQREFSSASELYEQLAGYYEQQGFFVNSPSREARYQVLLQFISGICPERTGLYRELLTYDLYLRENLKKRPAFALDPEPFRRQIRRLRTTRDYHVEVFFYPVDQEKAEQILHPSPEPIFLEFDYGHRSPLDHNAAVRRVDPESV
ncbi:MAG: B12-binding domain-containing radical SAM protein [Parasporobacterium sp.]|nr:B12-binding domain-containing radical SAM protein [Parasporobacterium sp.]